MRNVTYVAGVDGAGHNDFTVPGLTEAGAPYSGEISDRVVEVNGSIVTTGFSVVAGVLTFDDDLTTGDVLRVYRSTDYDDSLVDFPSPVRYSPVHHNKHLTQFLYI